MPPPWAAPPRTRRCRAPALLLAAVPLVLLLTGTGTAFGDAFSPESGGSPQAGSIDTLYWLVMVVAIIVFVGVEGALIYSMFKFRARRGAGAPPIPGHTRPGIGGTRGAPRL